MIGLGLNFIGTSVSAGQAAPVAVPASATSDAEVATDIRNQAAGNAGQLAPVASLSPSAVTAIGNTPETGNSTANTPDTDTAASEPEDGAVTPDNPLGLTEDEQAQVDELQQVDAEVRRHEQAHMTAGGQYAGQATYTYETGPDGGRYAVAGEVPIDTAPVADDPKATIDKMRVVIRAALAPAEPSAQDMRVASSARQTIVSASAELRAEERAEFQDRLTGNNDPADDISGPESGPSADNGANTGQTGPQNARGNDNQTISGQAATVYTVANGLDETPTREAGLSI